MQIIQRKICLVGSFAVGKTSLTRRFVEGRFDDNYLSTIGVKIARRIVKLPTRHVKLLVWDLAGGEDLVQKNDSYLRGLAAALIVCDLTRPETLTIAKTYADKVRSINLQAPIILLANKADLVAERQIDEETLRTVAHKMGAITYFVTSAKTGTCVNTAFETIALEATR